MIGEKTQALRLDLTQNRDVQRSDEKTNQPRQNRETDKKRITDRDDSEMGTRLCRQHKRGEFLISVVHDCRLHHRHSPIQRR